MAFIGVFLVTIVFWVIVIFLIRRFAINFACNLADMRDEEENIN